MSETATKATHTPGPWTARKSRGLNAYEVRGADGSYIGDIWGVDEPVPNGIKRDHQKPNARLIAAAPDLYEALKSVRGVVAASAEASHLLDGFGPRTVTAGDRLLQAVDAAIAKAEGK